MKPSINQQKVINSNDNLLVLASAGSGKTFCIVQKVTHLLKRILPEEILIISFTNETVNDLKRKLPDKIHIMTFHKLAIKILKDNFIQYSICSENLLKYIIDEYFISFITAQEKQKLLYYYFSFDYNFFLNSIEFKNLKHLIYTYIRLAQCNNYNFDDIVYTYTSSKQKFLISIIVNIYSIYQSEKNSQNLLDLNDLINKAYETSKISTFKCKYIFVDEFQDSSLSRFNLVYQIFKNSNSIINFFGDDFQSIYAFSGCNVNIMLNVKKHISSLQYITLDRNYRSDNLLINSANKFVMKNKNQIQKNIHSDKYIYNAINFVYYIDLNTKLYSLIDSINSEDILILGRYNSDIKNINTKYKTLTIHQSKGLEADYVILVNNKNSKYGFPSKIKNSNILNIFSENENILYAEERRLFYVAITRAKIKVYLLIPYSNPSIFIKEYKKIVKLS